MQKRRVSKCTFVTCNGLHENSVMNRKWILPEMFNVCNAFEEQGMHNSGRKSTWLGTNPANALGLPRKDGSEFYVKKNKPAVVKYSGSKRHREVLVRKGPLGRDVKSAVKNGDKVRGHLLGVPQPGCFKPGCLQFLRGNALLHHFALLCGLAFALICAPLRFSANHRTAFGASRTSIGGNQMTTKFLSTKLVCFSLSSLCWVAISYIYCPKHTIWFYRLSQSAFIPSQSTSQSCKTEQVHLIEFRPRHPVRAIDVASHPRSLRFHNLETKKSHDFSGSGEKSPPQPQRIARVWRTRDPDKARRRSPRKMFFCHFVVETRLSPTLVEGWMERLRAAGPRHGHGARKTFRTFHGARKGPQIDLACVESRGLVVPGAGSAATLASSFVSEPKIAPLNYSILPHGPVDICLDLLPAALPPVQEQDSQYKFL